MFTRIKISLSIPGADRPDRHFTFRLQGDLDKERCTYPACQKIFVVSDIEGNFQIFCKLLMKHGIIDRYFKWTFGSGRLVILGDCFDRGDQVTECLWLIYSLEEKATRTGGHVHFILGNHEIMNMNGDWRYVHPKYASALNTGKTPAALYDANSELWRWLQTKNIIEKIGDILFVHAGISEVINSMDYSIEEINTMTRKYYTCANVLFSNPLLHIVFNTDQSPFWYRGYYQGDATEAQIDATLARFHVRTIVTGHTIVDKVSAYYGGKVINVNTDHANGNSQALLISHRKFYRLDRQGGKEEIL